MRSLPVELDNEIKKEYSYITYAIELSLDSGTKRYIAFDINIRYNGLDWEARGFDFENAIVTLKNEIDYLSLKIDNVDGEFTNIINNEEIRKKTAKIYTFALQEPAKVVADAIVFQGLIDSITIDEKNAYLRIANPFILWKIKTPRRNHQATCPWEFKGNECGYTGTETECDQSFERCKQLGNECNFGGFRFLPSLQDKQIWWGRIPK